MPEIQNNSSETEACPNCCCGTSRADSFISSDKDSLHIGAKSTLMALHSLDEMIKLANAESEIYVFMIDQIDAYNEFKDKIEDACTIIDEAFDKVNVFNDLMLSGSIKMSTMMDASDTKRADMLIQGTTMGIIEITKTINENEKTLSNPCRELLYDILFAMNSFIHDMKKFL